MGFTDLELAKIIVFCLLTTVAHFFVGAVFFKTGVFTRIIAGLSLNAAGVVLVISYSAALAKPLVFVSLFLSFIFVIHKRNLDFDGVGSGLKKSSLALKLFGVSFLLVFLIWSYGASILNHPYLFNGHQNYFSGVSLEILNAEYYSRLRIFDNYPVEWGRYHFFNGALTALPQVLLSDRNLVTFMVAKIFVLVFFVFAVIELSMRGEASKRSVALVGLCVVYMLTMLPHQTWWSIFTNAYSSIFLLTLALLCWKNNAYHGAIFFVLCFGLSTSRSLLPAVFLIVTMTYLLHKNYRLLDKVSSKGWLAFVNDVGLPFLGVSFVYACLVVILAIGAMISSGEATTSPFIFGLRNFFSTGWLALMSPAITPPDEAMRNYDLSFLRPSKFWHLFWLSVLIYVSIKSVGTKPFGRQLQRFIDVCKKATKTQKFAIVFLLIVLATITYQNPITYKNHIIQLLLLYLLLYFVAPISLAIALAPTKLKELVVIFAIISLLQVCAFNPSISIPNFAVMEWIVLFGFLCSIGSQIHVTKRELVVFSAGLVLMVFSNGIPLSPLNIFELNKLDSTTKMLPHSEGRFNYSAGDRLMPYCFSGLDGDAALAAAKGRRVTYSKNKSDRYSISIHFGAPKQADLDYISKVCQF